MGCRSRVAGIRGDLAVLRAAQGSGRKVEGVESGEAMIGQLLSDTGPIRARNRTQGRQNKMG